MKLNFRGRCVRFEDDFYHSGDSFCSIWQYLVKVEDLFFFMEGTAVREIRIGSPSAKGSLRASLVARRLVNDILYARS